MEEPSACSWSRLRKRSATRWTSASGPSTAPLRPASRRPRGQHGMMERFIAEAADPERVRAMRQAIDHLSQAKGREYVSNVYIASTVPGEKYSAAYTGKMAATPSCEPTTPSSSLAMLRTFPNTLRAHSLSNSLLPMVTPPASRPICPEVRV